MDFNSADVVFRQSSREHLSELCDHLFRLFLHTLIEHRLAENAEELHFMLSELDKIPAVDLGESLNRLIVARFVSADGQPLMLRPRKYVRPLRSIDREAAAAWDEIFSICSLILVYRNNHQHQPDSKPSRTHNLVLVGAIVRLQELGRRLLPPGGKSEISDDEFYLELLSDLTREHEGERGSVVESGKKGNQSALSQEEWERPDALTSGLMSVLARIDIVGCSRLFSGIFGDDGSERPQFRGSSKEFNSTVKLSVARVLAELPEDERNAIMDFFFEDPDPEDNIDLELVQQALRMLRHPTRSESLRQFLYRSPDQ